MRVISSLAIATAIAFGSATFAIAQTAQYDYTDDQYLSYGPKNAAKSRAPAAVQHKRSPIAQFDRTEDSTLSYGGPKLAD